MNEKNNEPHQQNTLLRHCANSYIRIHIDRLTYHIFH